MPVDLRVIVMVVLALGTARQNREPTDRLSDLPVAG